MKFCPNCGKKIPSSVTFCSYCGAKQPQQNNIQQLKNTTSNNHHMHINKSLIVIIVIIIVVLCGFGYHHHEHGLDNAHLTTTLHSHDWSLTDGHKEIGNATFDGNNSMIIDHQKSLPINVHNNFITMVSPEGHINMKLIQRNGDNYIFKPANGEIKGHKIAIHTHYVKVGKERIDFIGKNGIKIHGHTYHDPNIKYGFHEWGLNQK